MRIFECAECGRWGIMYLDRHGKWTVDNTWDVSPEKHAKNIGLTK